MICKHNRIVASLVLAVAVLWTGAAHAHGLGWHSQDAAAVVIRFEYADGEPMAFGAVTVYSPASDTEEYQAGRADETGAFAFSPNAPGVWRFVADDGQGHRTSGEVTIDDPTATPATPAPATTGGAGRPGWQRIALGLSLLLNLGLAGLWWGRRRSGGGRG